MSKLESPTIESLIDQWDKDSDMDSTEPGIEILRIPILHNKYNKYLSLHNLAVKRMVAEIAKMRKQKWLYYNGKMSQRELEDKGWDQFPFTLKSDLNIYLDGDPDLGPMLSKKAYHEECASFCVNVMKELNNRTWQIRSYMDWQKFQQGM